MTIEAAFGRLAPALARCWRRARAGRCCSWCFRSAAPLQLAADPVGPKDCGAAADGADRVRRRAPLRPTRRDLTWLQRGGTVNDASCLSRTPVYGVVQVQSAEDVRQALAFARARGLKVSAAGVEHSMGGHAFARGGVVLDMTAFNRIVARRRVDERSRSRAAQPGTTSRTCCTRASRSRRCSPPTSSPSADRSRSTRTAWIIKPARSADRSARCA